MNKGDKKERLHLPNNFRDYDKLSKILLNDSGEDFEHRGQRRALKLFHDMSKRVPAYIDFLKKNNFDPTTVKNINDFKNVPAVSKDNYLRKYSLEDLSWDGKLASKQLIFCTTSGSTGEPFYFPHQTDQDWQYVALAELYLRDNFQIHRKSTLYINGFPMGAWIGGTFTHKAIRMVAEKGEYELSIISPGIHKKEIIKAVKALGDKFDQVIIGSYGPFMKDIIDDGNSMNIQWDKYNIGMIFSAEGFTETFRDHVAKKAGIKNPIQRTLNHYGTVDLGTMSYETPISILARKLAIKNNEIYHSLWGDSIKLPTLTQYIPELFYFEKGDETLYCSAFSGLPLVRYDLKDIGGVNTFDEISKVFKDSGINLPQEAKKNSISKIWKLPFVWVFERNDFSVSLYAFQIYPATIRNVLQMSKYKAKVTGKFTMLVKFDANHNQYLEVNVELMRGKKGDKSLEKEIVNSIIKQLTNDSSEYRETIKVKGKKIHPQVVFWDYEDETFFKPGIKQKWVKN